MMGAEKIKLNKINEMMEAEIKNKLKDLEAQHKVKILYACETGSRAWGFPSPDSDYDVRMIYMHEPDWYLSLQEGKSTIELMANDGDLDITGWDLRMSLRLLLKSNASMLERIQSPVVYKEQEGIVSQFREHAEKCFSQVATMYHYLGMGNTSFADVENQEMVKLKKLFYALRAALACKWVIDKESAPPIVFMTMVDELSFDETLKDRIKQLIVLKSGKNENYVHPVETALNQFIKLQLELGKAQANHLKGRKGNDVDLDLFFRNVLKMYGHEHK